MANLKLKDPNVNPEVNAGMKHELNVMRYIILGVVIIVVGILLSSVFALGGIVASSWAQKQGTYEQLENQVYDQNVKIDQLTQAVQNEQKVIQKN